MNVHEATADETVLRQECVDAPLGRFSGHKAYLCGPPPMIDAAITSLMQGRLFERDIFMERFLTAADGAGEGQRSALFKRI